MRTGVGNSKYFLAVYGIALAVVLLFGMPPSRVLAAERSSQPDYSEYYDQQARDSGAEDLPDALPEETRRQLAKLGVEGTDWDSITGVTPQSLFSGIFNLLGDNSGAPLRAAVSCVAVMLLCALFHGMKLSLGDRALGTAIGLVGTLCVCTVLIGPIVSCIQSAAMVIKTAAGFLLACVPVLTAILVAAGQPVSASSYNVLMMAAGNTISLVAAHVLVPLLNIFLAVSIVSAVSPTIRLDGLCELFAKVVKWILGFCMTIFTGLLTLHSIVATSLDSTGTRAARFVISSFVPVVGGAISEALSTINGCVRVLKSGVGAFSLLAGAFLFLPVLLQCLLWLLTLTVCASVGDVFELKEISTLLRAALRVVQTMLAILLCCMTILTVSTVILMIVGGVSS